MATSPLRDLLAFDLAEHERPADDVWLRVARGELSPEDAVAERREFDGADEPQLRQRLSLYVPPSEDARAESREELIARYFAETAGVSTLQAGGSDAESSSTSPSASVSDSDSEDSTADSRREAASTEEATEAPVIDLAARRRRLTIGSILAVAAAVLLTWVLVPRAPEGDPMPGFAPEWSNQYSGSMRGVEQTEGCERYKSDGRLLVRLRPEIALADDLVIAAIAQPPSGDPVRLAIDPTISADGVITVDQPVDALGLLPGEWTVSFFLSRGAQFSVSELAELSSADHPELAIIRSRVCIE